MKSVKVETDLNQLFVCNVSFEASLLQNIDSQDAANTRFKHAQRVFLVTKRDRSGVLATTR